MARLAQTNILQEIERRLRDTDPLLSMIGEVLLTDVAIGFETETDPAGRPWEPLAPGTRKRVKPGNTILKDSNLLFETIDMAVVSGESVHVGPTASLEYELIQHLGGSTGPPGANTIPARPYVGVSDDGLSEIRRTYLDYWFGF